MIHVCFALYDPSGFNSKFVGTAMLSLFENISKPAPSITVHILHDSTLTNDNRDKFNHLAGRYCQLVKFYNVEELCTNALEEMINLFPKINKNILNKSMFYKFFIPQVLSADLDKAIFFENKIVANLDVSKLWITPSDKMLTIAPVIETDSFKAEEYLTSSVLIMNLKLLRTQKEYLNSSILLMNLNISRNQSETVKSGATAVDERNYYDLLEQTVWDNCFSQNIAKLPSQFNQIVGLARRNKETITKKIYNYTADTLQLDTNEPFNQLWLEYFSKTSWFNPETIGRLYNGFKQSYAQLNDTMKVSVRNISAIMSGKTRAFFTLPGNVEMIKKNFLVRDDEEIILAQGQDAIKNLVDAMRQAAGKKIFFIMLPNFPFAILNQAGFAFGRDFLNGWEFLSQPNNLPALNSYPLVQVM